MTTYCLICVMLLGRRALPAITLVAGDPVCWDHVAIRVNRPLLAAIEVARGDLEAMRP